MKNIAIHHKAVTKLQPVLERQKKKRERRKRSKSRRKE
jgi:hypothetical protein